MITSTDDGLFPPHLVIDSADRLANASIVEVAGAGHSTYFERPDVYNDALIAFIEKGEMKVGVVLKPVDWVCTFARTGAGCWRYRGADGEPAPCYVGTATEMEGATVTQSRSKTAKASPVVAKLNPAKVLETYSAGLKLAQVASGEADVYANIYPQFNPAHLG